MIKNCLSLSPEQEEMVSMLLTTCAENDHAKVPIQFDHGLNFFKEMPSWFLCLEEGALIGVVSVFNPLAGVAELSGCIRPDQRNRGKFGALLQSCYKELARNKINKVLFVVDHASKSGMGITRQLSLTEDHTEYLMTYDNLKEPKPSHVHVREAQKSDTNEFAAINAKLFHETFEESENILLSCFSSKDKIVYMAEVEGLVIGICTVYYSEKKTTIYGLGIREACQGKGYGSGLVHAILKLLKDGKYTVELEVDSLNGKAHKLYKKVGFEEIKVMGYYEMLLPV